MAFVFQGTGEHMTALATNRDLYLALQALLESRRDNTRTLETYLCALLGLAMPFENMAAIPSDHFLSALSAAFDAEPAAFDPQWREDVRALSNHTEGFAGWRALMIRQIVDLNDMAVSGLLQNEYRHFGIDAPHGGRWYNFDTHTYLECALAGSYGGWEPGDTGGRQLVPGQVATLDNDGRLITVDAADTQRPEFDLAQFTWEDFKDFIECGQIYE